ncbi:condensin complex subunit 3, partial [Phenoliferia sp. Uapishka_3]
MPPRRAPAAQVEPAAPVAALLPETTIFSPHPNPLLQIPSLFAASQSSIATHRKNINTLHSIFLKAAAVTTLSSDGKSLRLTGEKAFGEAFRYNVVYPLGVKKGVEQADRLIKFVAGFVGFAVEFDTKKKAAERGPDQQEDEEDEDDDDGPASRLVAQLLTFLLKGFQAKNKVARFRCVQLVALMVNGLGEIDVDSYQLLKDALLERVRDKEANVRMQAVVALSKLQGDDDADSSSSSDDDSDAESTPSSSGDGQKVASVLADVLTHDPAAFVSSSSLPSSASTTQTLLSSPSKIATSAEQHPINRRAAFTHVLSEVPVGSLTREQREEVIARGLKDREESVRRAAGKVVSKWAEEVGGAVKFLELFDLREDAIAEKALVSIFEARPDLIEVLDFDGPSLPPLLPPFLCAYSNPIAKPDEFYAHLTPSTSFLARVYFKYLRDLSDPRLAELEPVITALAYFIEIEWTKLVVLIEAEEKEDVEEAAAEFVVGQLVGVAVSADYGDEIGRRKMFDLMRKMLGFSALPTSLIPRCLDVLSKGTSERDFMRIVVEIIQVLRADSSLVTSESEGADSDAETQASDDDANGGGGRRRKKGKGRTPVERGEGHTERRKELDLRCLSVTRALLERVMGTLQDNSMVHGLVFELIVPAVKSKDHEIRAQGLVSLGLCCLIDKTMALDSFALIARQSQDAEGPMQVKALQIVFDMLILYGINFGAERNFGPEVILGFLINSLNQEEPDVLATTIVGVSKLMLSGMITDEEVLKHLVLAYFAIETSDNHELRQCLSYFLPVYCYSNPQNQRRVGNSAYDELDDKTAMVTPLQIGLQLVDWTDPQKAVQSDHVKPDESIQFDLACEMTRLLYVEEKKDDRKLLCQLLPKLYIPEEIDEIKVKCLLVLINSLKLNRPLADAVSKNALIRFENGILKTFGDRVEALTEEELSTVEEMTATLAFIRSEEGEVTDDEEEEEDAGEGEDEEESGAVAAVENEEESEDEEEE